MKKVLILLLVILTVSFKHPFYLSVTDLKYNSKEKALQGSVKIFVNDLEATLKKIHKKNIDLINIKDTVETKKILNAYLLNHILVKVNGKQRTYDLLGFEREEEAIWMYIEFKKCEQPKKIEIENSILFEQLKEQTNIVHIEVNGQNKSLKGTNPDKGFIFEF